MTRAIASVPGKLILMGEHAAVYGRPVLVATIGLGVVVRAERREGAGVDLDLRDLRHRERAGWADVVETAARARAAWTEYAESPTPGRFAALASSDPARLVKVALGEAAKEAGRDELPGLAISVHSELPVGSGFGSSAAVAVGVLAASLAVLEVSTDRASLDRLALEVERRQHGTPSGADHKTVLRGGVLQMTREGGALKVDSIAVAPGVLERFQVLHTGVPEASTGEVVATVRALRGRDPVGFEHRLDTMAEIVVSFARRLVEESPDWEQMASLMVDYERCLEEIGVVPPAVARAITAARSSGLAAKISGAGGLSDAGAGSLLVLDPSGEARLPESLADYAHYPAPLGVAGLSVEVSP